MQNQVDASGFNSLVWSVIGAAVLALLGVLVRLVLKILKAVSIFLDDWMGDGGRPGVPARPGVMERIGSGEDRHKSSEGRLDRVEGRVDGLERQVGRLMLGPEDGREGLLGGARRTG